MSKVEYKEKMMEFCNNDEELYEETVFYFERKMEYISGFRALKEYLIIYTDDEDKMKKMKRAFK